MVTNPDAPQGRSKRLVPSPVKQAALELELPVLHAMPKHFGTSLDAESRIGETDTDAECLASTAEVGVIVAYGKILPREALEAMPKGFINLHFSLLPAWRGAAPVQRAIESGDAKTGVTVFELQEGLDDGPIYTQQQFDILEDETSGELLQRLSAEGIPAVLEALHLIEQGAQPTAQADASGATYANKLLKSEARIDWSLPPEQIVRHINAFSPNPGAFFEVQVGSKPPQRIIALKARAPKSISVANSDADANTEEIWHKFRGIELVRVKPAGKNAMPGRDWLRGVGNTDFAVI